MPAGNDFVAIAAGYFHSLALKSDGSLAGWGDNLRADERAGGQRLRGHRRGVLPQPGAESDGSLAGWGNNAYGQTNVPAGNNFVAIAAGGSTAWRSSMVPEPASIALLALGLPFLVGGASRRSGTPIAV